MKTSKPSVTRTSILGPILPDEMVWSYYARVLSRFPALTFDGLASLLGNELPSHRKAFPARLGNLAGAFNYTGAPDATGLAMGHTFFPFAVPEIRAHEAERLAATLAHHSFPTGAPNHLVLPGSFKLRVCPDCVVQDREKHGVAYWHRCHQVPYLRTCIDPAHRDGLHETDVVAGTKYPVSADVAVRDLVPLAMRDPRVQVVLANAVKALADGPANASGDQVRHEFGETLRRHGLYGDRQVSAALTQKLRESFDPAELSLIGVGDHEVGLLGWCSVPKLAVALAVLGESFCALLERAAGCTPTPTWLLQRGKVMERECRMAEKVRQYAPEVVKTLAETNPRRITAWSIATALKPALGAGFASNWSYKPMVKAVLQEWEESQEQFELRALERMRKDPAAAYDFTCASDYARSFGIKTSLEHDQELGEKVRHLFDSAWAARGNRL